MIEKNVNHLLASLKNGNCFSEPITLVAATKTRTAEEINRAVRAGITDVGENRVQEFTQKFDMIQGARRHFIGRLQTNKVKYLIGKADLIHSVDRDELADEIAKRSLLGCVQTNVLIQINIGEEKSKGGYPAADGFSVFRRLRERTGLRVCGFMAMLPVSDDFSLLGTLADRMRSLYERARDLDDNVRYLSMGMSGDWELCLEHGANMIRLGTAIFGSRSAL